MNVEILSPAGDIECLKAAVRSGASAVYIGLNKFNARMKVDNFSEENLDEWVSYAHFYGVKIYVTINTLIKEHEFGEAFKLAKLSEELNADALILTDLGLIDAVLSNLTIPVFVSTQVNAHNLDGALFLEEMGVNGIVLSRETQLIDIENICKNTKIPIECFIHGAMCVSVSGQCYLSAYIDGNSGNRGLCAQACRRFYRCYDENNNIVNKGYLLSQKDLCGTTTIHKLKEIGVKVFKIEGRSRRKEYVSETAEIYRNCLKCNKCTDNGACVNRLKEVFNRGDFTEGYAFGNKFNLIYPYMQGHKGRFVGKVKSISDGTILINGYDAKPGDAYKITRNNNEVGNAVYNKGRIVYKGEVCVGDEVNITSSMLPEKVDNERLVYIHFFCVEGEKIKITASTELNFKTLSVSIEGEIAEMAKQKATSTEEIEKQLRKTGGSGFIPNNILINCANSFVPVSEINALRRDVLLLLREEVIKQYNLSLKRRGSSIRTQACENTDELRQNCLQSTKKSAGSLIVCLSEYSEIDNIKFDGVDKIIYRPWDYGTVAQFAKKINRKFYLELPNLLSQTEVILLKELANVEGFAGFVVNNVFGLRLAAEVKADVVIGLGMNVSNQKTFDFIDRYCTKQGINADYIISQELNASEISSIKHTSHVFAEGEIYCMTLAHCPVNLNFKVKCDKCRTRTIKYKDEAGAIFKIKRRKVLSCYFNLCNSVDLSIYDKLSIAGNYFLNLVDKNAQHIQNVIDAYVNLNNCNKKTDYKADAFTRGAYTRLVK